MAEQIGMPYDVNALMELLRINTSSYAELKQAYEQLLCFISILSKDAGGTLAVSRSELEKMIHGREVVNLTVINEEDTIKFIVRSEDGTDGTPDNDEK